MSPRSDHFGVSYRELHPRFDESKKTCSWIPYASSALELCINWADGAASTFFPLSTSFLYLLEKVSGPSRSLGEIANLLRREPFLGRCLGYDLRIALENCIALVARNNVTHDHCQRKSYGYCLSLLGIPWAELTNLRCVIPSDPPAFIKFDLFRYSSYSPLTTGALDQLLAFKREHLSGSGLILDCHTRATDSDIEVYVSHRISEEKDVWLEDPFPYAMREQYARLPGKCRVAVGEYATEIKDFDAIATFPTADIIQPEVARCGGHAFGYAQELAKALGAVCMPHGLALRHLHSAVPQLDPSVIPEYHLRREIFIELCGYSPLQFETKRLLLP